MARLNGGGLSARASPRRPRTTLTNLSHRAGRRRDEGCAGPPARRGVVIVSPVGREHRPTVECGNYCAVQPPSTDRIAPFTIAPASDAR